MINYIWAGMLIFGMIVAIIKGRMEQVSHALLQSGQEAVTLCLGLVAILVFWLGMMKIAEEAGLLKFLQRLFSPFLKRLFPEVPENHPALGYILSNTVMNFFGLGNAATPMGIKAMSELKELNGNADEPSRSMITLLALNTAGLTLIPTTVIAIRMKYGSASPEDILLPTFIATCCATIAAIVIDRFFYYRRVRRERKK